MSFNSSPAKSNPSADFNPGAPCIGRPAALRPAISSACLNILAGFLGVIPRNCPPKVPHCSNCAGSPIPVASEKSLPPCPTASPPATSPGANAAIAGRIGGAICARTAGFEPPLIICSPLVCPVVGLTSNEDRRRSLAFFTCSSTVLPGIGRSMPTDSSCFFTI